jgi:hypothetical protein
MKIPAYRLRSAKKLHAFGDRVEDIPLLGERLEDFQKRALAAAGFDLRGDVESLESAPQGSLVYAEDLVVTEALLRKIAARWAEFLKGARSLRFGLKDNEFNRTYVLPHEEGPSGGQQLFPLFAKLTQSSSFPDEILAQEVIPFGLPIPKQMVKEGYLHYPLCEEWMSRMASPFHVLQANLALNSSRGFSVIRRVPEFLRRRLLSMGTKDFYRGLGRLNRIGKNCRIHPTALLEGAVIGDNVTIGAYAVVRMSHVGAGTHIEDQACVRYSVLGEGNFIAQGNHVHLCLSYSDAFLIHGPYQFSVFGASTAVMAVINCDVRLDEATIKIPTDVGVLDSRLGLMGVAYGHRAKVGGGNIIAPGRIVPNDWREAPPDFIRMEFGP